MSFIFQIPRSLIKDEDKMNTNNKVFLSKFDTKKDTLKY